MFGNCKLLALVAGLVATATMAKVLKFPKYFKFGVATSAYQIEGAWNVSGKGQSIWDYYTHLEPDQIIDRSNGDIACDSYHKLDEDIKNLIDLGVHFYRFSMSWPRILPTGHRNVINADGVRYYNELINKLLANGIEPIVTLYHWDLPQTIQDLGGWTNRLIVKLFGEYVRICYELFGNRVKKWITINEPWTFCGNGYENATLAPFVLSPGVGSYLCGHYVLLAHANAYHIYRKEFHHKQQGSVGITIETSWFFPKNQSSRADQLAADRALDFHFGWMAHPIFSKDCNYPKVMIERIAKLSKEQNFPESRLPKFSDEEIAKVCHSADFIGLNHYTSFMVADNKTLEKAETFPSRQNDVAADQSQDMSWPGSARDFFRSYPSGMRSLLNYLKNKYGNPPVIITENGYAGLKTETLHDKERIAYHRGYLTAVLNATVLDNCNVQAYTLWSFMDNFEWRDGYSMRFGVYHVDFNDPELTRKPKDSAHMYRDIIRSRQIRHHY